MYRIGRQTRSQKDKEMKMAFSKSMVMVVYGMKYFVMMNKRVESSNELQKYL